MSINYVTFLALAGLYFAVSCAKNSEPSVKPPDNGNLLLSDLPQGIFDLLQDPSTQNAAVQKSAKSVFKLERVSGVLGSGVFIESPQVILTNAHVLGPTACLATGCRVRVHINHEHDHPGVAQSLWLTLVPYAYSEAGNGPKNLDVAAYKVFRDLSATVPFQFEHSLSLSKTNGDLPTSETALSSAAVGEKVTLIGSPLGYLKKTITGKLVGKGNPFLSSEMLTLPGTSGGAIVNEKGEFLALHHKGTQNLEYLRNSGYFGVSLSTSAPAILDLFQDEVRTNSLRVFKRAEQIETDAQKALFAEALAVAPSKNLNISTGIAESLWQVCNSLTNRAPIENPSEAGDSSTSDARQQACLIASQMIDCNQRNFTGNSDENADIFQSGFTFCPDASDSQPDSWNAQFAARATIATASDEALFYWGVSAPLRLEKSAPGSVEYRAAAKIAAENWYRLTGSGRKVGDAVRVLDVTGSAKLAGEDTLSWFNSFREIQNYYFQYPQFLRGVYLLGQLNKMPFGDSSSSLQQTRTDPNATLLDTLLADYLHWRLQKQARSQIEGGIIYSSVYLLP